MKNTGYTKEGWQYLHVGLLQENRKLRNRLRILELRVDELERISEVKVNLMRIPY
jgi:hypothetical protein